MFLCCVGWYFWIYAKAPLYILFICRLWYGFHGTKYEYPLWVFGYFGFLLVAQLVILSVYFFVDSAEFSYGFFDVFWVVYAILDLVLIGSNLILFVRRLTSLAVAQTVEKALQTGEVSVVPSSTRESKLKVTSPSSSGQTHVSAASQDDDGEEAPQTISVSKIDDSDAVVLDKKQKKLVFEITRYILLTSIAMLSTFVLGVFITYLFWKLNDSSCGFDCINNLYAVFGLLLVMDSMINMIAIHLNSGFQKKNYASICKLPHRFVYIRFESYTKKRAVEKANAKLNAQVEMHETTVADDHGSDDDDDYHYEDTSDSDYASTTAGSTRAKGGSNASNVTNVTNASGASSGVGDDAIGQTMQRSEDDDKDSKLLETAPVASGIVQTSSPSPRNSKKQRAKQNSSKAPTLAQQHSWDFD